MCVDSLPLLQCIASRLDWNTPAFKATILVTGKLNQIRSLWRTNIFDIINLPVWKFSKRCMAVHMYVNCGTRWACRYAACTAVRERLPALMQLLSYLAAGDNAKRAVEAKALLNALDCQFVLMLLFMCDVLGQTQSLSVMLQSTEINFSGPIDLLDVICASITECRSPDEHFCKVWSDAMNLCDSCGIEFTVDDSCNVATAAPPSRKRKLPTKFADSHVMQTLGDRPRTDSRDGF